MKTPTILILLAITGGGLVVANAQLQFVPDMGTPSVFGAADQRICAIWHNAGSTTTTTEICFRLYQTSSATAVLLNESRWKQLQVLAGQTVIESASLNFPQVREETRFLVQWLENTNKVIGSTEVLVYPTNLWRELKSLADDELLGIFDPSNHLKPLLVKAAVKFLDLENAGMDDFSGKLAIVESFQSNVELNTSVARTIQKLAQKGVPVVWIQPPIDRKDPITPSFYVVSEGKGTVVVVQPELVSNLSKNPRAQLNLLQFARLALNPKVIRLPDLSSRL